MRKKCFIFCICVLSLMQIVVPVNLPVAFAHYGDLTELRPLIAANGYFEAISGLDPAEVKEINFVKELPSKYSSLTPTETFCAFRDNLTQNGYIYYGTDAEYVAYIVIPDGAYLPEDARYFFANGGWNTLTGLNLLNTSYVSNMGSMFEGLTKLQSLDLQGWDVSKVEDASNMFDGCKLLANLNMNGWNFSQILFTTAYMFRNCNQLLTLDLSGWYMNGAGFQATDMLSGCESLTQIIVPKTLSCQIDLPSIYSWKFVTENGTVIQKPVYDMNGSTVQSDSYDGYEMLVGTTSQTYTLTAKDFHIGTGWDTTEPKGPVTPKELVLRSEAKLKNGSGTEISLLNGDTLATGVRLSGLELNEDKYNNKTGTFDVTISYSADDGGTASATIKVTLDPVRYKFDFDGDGDVDSDDIDVMVEIEANLKQSSGTECTNAWLRVLDADDNKKIAPNDVRKALRVKNAQDELSYICVPEEYLQYMV